MKLVWHIVMKDARRLWPAAGLWALLFSAHQFMAWRVSHTVFGDTETLPRLKFFELLFFVVQLLSSYVFAATLVLEDSPVGTSTFWATRPIAGARLLAAKIVSCFLWFLLLAMLLSLPWWMFNQREQRDLVLEAVTLFRWQTWTVGAAVVIAAFTGGLGRFLLGSFGVIFAALLMVLAFNRHGTLAVDSLRFLAPVAATGLWLHYQRRRTRLALGLLVIGAISSAAFVFSG